MGDPSCAPQAVWVAIASGGKRTSDYKRVVLRSDAVVDVIKDEVFSDESLPYRMGVQLFHVATASAEPTLDEEMSALAKSALNPRGELAALGSNSSILAAIPFATGGSGGYPAGVLVGTRITLPTLRFYVT